MGTITGITTIELMNTEGEVVQSVTDENMITDTFYNLFKSGWHNGFGNNYNVIAQLLPLGQKALGGIFLLDKAQVEDVNKVIPDAGSVVVGNAGSSTYNARATQGILNETESGAIENGWRNVWEFATDKANGTIACACLTTQKGGDIGIKLKDLPQLTTSADFRYTTQGNIQYTPWKIRSLTRMCVHKNSLVYYEATTQTINRIDDYINSEIDLKSTYYIDNVANLKLPSLSKKIADISSTIPTNPLVYSDGTHIYLVREVSYRWLYYKLDFDFNPIEEGNFDFATSSTNRGDVLAIIGDYVLIRNDVEQTKMKIYSMTTKNLVKTILNSNGSVVYSYSQNLFEYNGYLISSDFVNTSIIDLDLEIMYIIPIGLIKQDLSAGSFYYWQNNTSFISTNLTLMYPQIHSINNLDTPVVKTSDLTMKVTYDLIQQ